MTELTVNVVHRREYQGKDAVYIGRPEILGNPFTIKQHGRNDSLVLYKNWLNLQFQTGNKRITDEIHRLAAILKKEGTITLSCWCAPKPCHGDLLAKGILKLANRL